MIALLGFILDGIVLMGEYVLWGIESAFNVISLAITAAVAFIFLVLPQMPAVPAPPPVIQYINWAFPVGDVLVVLTSFIVAWVGFLAVRIMMRWTRSL